jgi:hypothetical protein
MTVVVLDRRKKPQTPCTEPHARRLLQRPIPGAPCPVIRTPTRAGRRRWQRRAAIPLISQELMRGGPQTPQTSGQTGQTAAMEKRHALAALPVSAGSPSSLPRQDRQEDGCQPGDHSCAAGPEGTPARTHISVVAARPLGSFNGHPLSGLAQDSSHCLCRLMQHSDGYGHGQRQAAILSATAVTGFLAEVL